MLEELLSEYDSCPLECDDLTRVLHSVLYRQGIEHTCFVGSITDTSKHKGFSPHFWIELPDSTVIDYRARMWLGNKPEVPHGIFSLNDYHHIAYKGDAVDLEPLPQTLFDVLTGRVF